MGDWGRIVNHRMDIDPTPFATHHLPLAGLIQDALAYPLFSGGNIGFRRRRLQALLADPAYDPWSTIEED